MAFLFRAALQLGRAHIVCACGLRCYALLGGYRRVGEVKLLRLQNAIEAVHKELQTLWMDLPKDAPTELGRFYRRTCADIVRPDDFGSATRNYPQLVITTPNGPW